ncbi:MAG: hypothetical protein AAB649_05175 [Patescibacteria group bacterium]
MSTFDSQRLYNQIVSIVDEILNDDEEKDFITRSTTLGSLGADEDASDYTYIALAIIHGFHLSNKLKKEDVFTEQEKASGERTVESLCMFVAEKIGFTWIMPEELAHA